MSLTAAPAPAAAHTHAPAAPDQTPLPKALSRATPEPSLAAPKTTDSSKPWYRRDFIIESGIAVASVAVVGVLETVKRMRERAKLPPPAACIEQKEWDFLASIPASAWKDIQTPEQSAQGVRKLMASVDGAKVKITTFLTKDQGIVFQIASGVPNHRFGFQILDNQQTRESNGAQLQKAKDFFDAVIRGQQQRY